jgi:mRNA interferase RelE/StbE
MAKYRVEVSATAERQIGSLPRAEQIRILRAIRALADDPMPPGRRKLSGYDDVWRIRVGAYRVLYSIDGNRLVVLVLKVGHRKDVYR